ncbi:hypothetical protein [Bacillus chungangensis]|uniref:Uncharacterized protein n=1 Tax=Bacillus chungangensis TaxID=587633 RepID=A0ABT9WPG5_9BACI|nr:hypothetical protein [Bacillus chungangensis]MDQ0174660.1 hypothetical protein [Bacillus chungangensis]
MSITDTTFTTYSKGYTSETFWWGIRATYNNQQAKDAISQLRSASVDAGLITAALFWIPQLGSVTGITSAYLENLQKTWSQRIMAKALFWI